MAGITGLTISQQYNGRVGERAQGRGGRPCASPAPEFRFSVDLRPDVSGRATKPAKQTHPHDNNPANKIPTPPGGRGRAPARC